MNKVKTDIFSKLIFRILKMYIKKMKIEKNEKLYIIKLNMFFT